MTSENPPLGIPVGARIAVVDDDASCRDALVLVLRRLGLHGESFDSVSALVRSHALQRVQCIILDVLMPDIDGLTAQITLRQTNYQIPIIICSGLSEHEVGETALGNGAVSFLRKPVRREALIEALQAAFQSEKSRGR